MNRKPGEKRHAAETPQLAGGQKAAAADVRCPLVLNRACASANEGQAKAGAAGSWRADKAAAEGRPGIESPPALQQTEAKQQAGAAGELAAQRRVQASRGSKRLLMNGVVLMAGAALLSKLIGVFQKIPLQNLAGDRVFGIYNAVYPFYQLAAVLATAGLPTAVSLLIAERLRKGMRHGGNQANIIRGFAAAWIFGHRFFWPYVGWSGSGGGLDRRC